MSKISKNTMYLICPSDCLEYSIKTSFSGEAYYYTALGVYFEFDIPTQLNLWEIIFNNNIDQILFVTSMNNQFYQDACRNIKTYPSKLTESLQETSLEITHDKEVHLLNHHFYTFVGQHLKNQISRLINTEYLGEQIKDYGLQYGAFVYQPKLHCFLELEELEWKGLLFNNISCN